MPVESCPTCGKRIPGNSEAQAKANLKNHRVSHGEYNRLNHRKTHKAKMKDRYAREHSEKKKRAEDIRKKAKEILKGNSFGLTAKILRKKLGKKYTLQQVAHALRFSDKIVEIGKSWILESERI